MCNSQGRKDTGNVIKGGGSVLCLVSSPAECTGQDGTGGKPQHPASVLGVSPVSFWNIPCVLFVNMNGQIGRAHV